MSLYNIHSPSQIKDYSIEQLNQLADEIRSFLIESISKTGGHLSSNLGIVELTIALHYVFSTPKDKIIFDVGHQSYVHKILTGRSNRFSTLRQFEGLSGFQRRAESPHDPFEAGHSSTSLSAALGYAIARDIQKQDYEVISVIGDGALTGGEALEALNDIGAKQKKVIIIFNDNKMSISKNHGGVEQRITSLRSSHMYREIKKDLKSNLSQNALGSGVLHTLTNIKDKVKHEVIKAPLFQEFNLDYMGPIDGHDIEALIKVLHAAKEHHGPIVVHVVTKKGKGYSFAEQDQVGKWHGVSAFDIQTGRSLKSLPANEKSWSEVISSTLITLANQQSNIVAITPAMAQGAKLLEFSKKFPDRFFDCGIAEQHAITMACGMACGGLHPFVSVYSSFLQRAYDQMNHDLGRMDLPCVIGIDRAGLVGEDGDTHQGIYDIAMLRNIPNLVLSQPKDAKEAQDLLFTAFQYDHPFCIRYPRGNTHCEKNKEFQSIEIGTWTKEQVGNDPSHIVISYGPDVDRICQKAKENDVSLLVVNARFFKPLDTDMLDELFSMGLPISIFETDCKIGSLSSAILEYKNDYNHDIKVYGIEDHFVEHGSIRCLRFKEHIHIESLFEDLEHE